MLVAAGALQHMNTASLPSFSNGPGQGPAYLCEQQPHSRVSVEGQKQPSAAPGPPHQHLQPGKQQQQVLPGMKTQALPSKRKHGSDHAGPTPSQQHLPSLAGSGMQQQKALPCVSTGVAVLVQAQQQQQDDSDTQQKEELELPLKRHKAAEAQPGAPQGTPMAGAAMGHLSRNGTLSVAAAAGHRGPPAAAPGADKDGCVAGAPLAEDTTGDAAAAARDGAASKQPHHHQAATTSTHQKSGQLVSDSIQEGVVVQQQQLHQQSQQQQQGPLTLPVRMEEDPVLVTRVPHSPIAACGAQVTGGSESEAPEQQGDVSTLGSVGAERQGAVGLEVAATQTAASHAAQVTPGSARAAVVLVAQPCSHGLHSAAPAVITEALGAGVLPEPGVNSAAMAAAAPAAAAGEPAHASSMHMDTQTDGLAAAADAAPTVDARQHLTSAAAESVRGDGCPAAPSPPAVAPAAALHLNEQLQQELLEQLLVIKQRLQESDTDWQQQLLLELLQLLPMTSTLLMRTQLGPIVMQLARAGQTVVKRPARQLVLKWRALVAAEAEEAPQPCKSTAAAACHVGHNQTTAPTVPQHLAGTAAPTTTAAPGFPTAAAAADAAPTSTAAAAAAGAPVGRGPARASKPRKRSRLTREVQQLQQEARWHLSGSSAAAALDDLEVPDTGRRSLQQSAAAGGVAGAPWQQQGRVMLAAPALRGAAAAAASSGAGHGSSSSGRQHGQQQQPLASDRTRANGVCKAAAVGTKRPNGTTSSKAAAVQYPSNAAAQLARSLAVFEAHQQRVRQQQLKPQRHNQQAAPKRRRQLVMVEDDSSSDDGKRHRHLGSSNSKPGQTAVRQLDGQTAKKLELVGSKQPHNRDRPVAAQPQQHVQQEQQGDGEPQVRFKLPKPHPGAYASTAAALIVGGRAAPAYAEAYMQPRAAAAAAAASTGNWRTSSLGVHTTGSLGGSGGILAPAVKPASAQACTTHLKVQQTGGAEGKAVPGPCAGASAVQRTAAALVPGGSGQLQPGGGLASGTSSSCMEAPPSPCLDPELLSPDQQLLQFPAEQLLPLPAADAAEAPPLPAAALEAPDDLAEILPALPLPASGAELLPCGSAAGPPTHCAAAVAVGRPSWAAAGSGGPVVQHALLLVQRSPDPPPVHQVASQQQQHKQVGAGGLQQLRCRTGCCSPAAASPGIRRCQQEGGSSSQLQQQHKGNASAASVPTQQQQQQQQQQPRQQQQQWEQQEGQQQHGELKQERQVSPVGSITPRRLSIIRSPSSAAQAAARQSLCTATAAAQAAAGSSVRVGLPASAQQQQQKEASVLGGSGKSPAAGSGRTHPRSRAGRYSWSLEECYSGEWTPTEVEVLRDGLRACGKDWASLQQLLPHRQLEQLRAFCELHLQDVLQQCPVE